MYQETFDFYDSTSIKIYNLDKKIRYELSILDRLDPMTKRHSENVGNLTGRICQYLRLPPPPPVPAFFCVFLFFYMILVNHKFHTRYYQKMDL